MNIAYLITHPEVVVDPNTPVPKWHLSDKGVHRMRAFAAMPDLSSVSAVWASAETKAIEAAGGSPFRALATIDEIYPERPDRG